MRTRRNWALWAERGDGHAEEKGEGAGKERGTASGEVRRREMEEDGKVKEVRSCT
jgi:hypothetical protein